MKLKKLFTVGAVLLTSTALLAACSSGSKSSSKTEESKSDSKVTKITVAQTADSRPYSFMDGDKLTGFDIEVLKAVDEALPQYEFDYKKVPDDSIIMDVDTGRAQIGANNFGKTPEREKKYLFTYPISQNVNAIFSRKGDNFKSIADLVGKKTLVPTGSNYGAIYEQWNKENPDKKIDFAYSEDPLKERMAAVESGKIDFMFASKSNGEILLKENGLDLVNNVPDLKDYPIFATYEYFLLGQDQKDLQEAVNTEIKKLSENGKLKELSEKFYGADYVPGEDQYK
ncbi:transporter substrate-binding domain-containing protein [Floricoccus penangensis]|uniref:ABC transporter substrate-binding protein n=1 Tax=Floricoccus penangensis TaxID=1859475 RepID=A0A9Q5P192_9LACT|nr:transporter substrate-binding domain-containing protein [Floricoccus penangensis]OFI47787.1 ABC transporter substrate-binding protein [Floricoccus penangensis]URZ88194.1 transporter substrate-binding domain-containing protein [Floricoccus penangensis]